MVKVSSKRASSTSKPASKSANASTAASKDDEDEDEDMEEEEDDDSSQSFLNNAPVQSLNRTDSGEKKRWTVNQLSWHSTGVISDLPPRSTSVASADIRRDGSRHRALKADHEARHRSTDEMDTAIAAEMALKEVLGKLKDASTRSAHTGLYDFDLFELNFPALCLKVLPVPSTLKSRVPFPTNDSWALLPPGARQWDALQKAVNERIVAHQRVVSMAHNSSNSILLTPPPVDIDASKIYNHLNDAWNHWQALNPTQMMEAWQLESLRMFSEADEARKESQKKLQEKVLEIAELKKDLVALRRDMELGTNDSSPALSHPSVPPISPKTLQDLWTGGFDPRQWEYESLIEKWKSAMRERRQSSNGMAAQKRLSAAPTQLKPVTKRREEARGRTGQKATPKSAKNAPRNNKVSDQSTKVSEPQSHNLQDAEGEIIDIEQPHHQPVPPQPSHTPVPPSPRIDTTHLTPLHMQPQQDQRRSSIQLSPHSIPNQHDQQRRHSIQFHQISPQAQQAPEPPAPQAPPMIQYAQAPPAMLHIPHPEPASSQPLQMQSPFSAQATQMQNWIPPQQHPHPLSAVSISPQPPPQAQFGPYAGMGLQVHPQPDARRGSHPMIDPTGQHVDMQGVDVDAPQSAGGYLDARMHAVGMDGVQVGMSFVGPGMDMPVVGAGGGRVG